MPRLLPPHRPDFTTETSPLLHLLHTTSHIALLTTTLALLLLACALILFLRLCVMWDRWGSAVGEGRDGGYRSGRMAREEKILKVCEEKGRRVCERRGVWDVGVRGGGEKTVGDVGGRKKLRFVPGVEVIPPVVGGGVEGKGKGRACVSECECENESGGGSRSRTRSRTRSRSLGASDEWFESTTSWAAESSRRNRGQRMERASGAEEVMVVVPRRERADWVSTSEFGGASFERVVESAFERGEEELRKEGKEGKKEEEEPVVFFGGGSWIRRVRNRSVTLSGSLGVREV